MISLSIVIPCLDDPAILDTVRSIRATAGDFPEIVIVNDAGLRDCAWATIEQIPNVKVVQNRNRCGSGPCRHIGSLHAESAWLLHTDAHMRFTSGWHDKWQAILENERRQAELDDAEIVGDGYTGIDALLRTVFCGTMIAINHDGKHNGLYRGATMNFLGPDPGNPKVQQVFEANWLRGDIPNGHIPCVMGACWFVSAHWYHAMAPHRFLRSWGVEEQMISLKTWLSGGQVKLMRDVEIGHIFRNSKARFPYDIPPADIIYNKIFAMRTLLPDALTDKLEVQINDPALGKAQMAIVRDWHLIEAERASFRPVKTIQDFVTKFNIPLPDYAK